MPRRRSFAFGVVAIALFGVVAGCGSGGTAPVPLPATTPTDAAPTSTSQPTPMSTPTSTGTVWLCKPDVANNPCLADTETTVVRADSSEVVRPSTRTTGPAIDCFYVYPTVSRDKGVSSDLSIDPEERAVAVTQAARFSSVCHVYAPMYRQITSAAIDGKAGAVTSAAAATAYTSVRAAWLDYLAHDNDGHGVVLIGHSQGAFLLDALVKRVIDPSAAQRKLLVSALLIGGNVRVPDGRDVGGDFQHVPACRRSTQTACVVAYSTFQGDPPVNAFFGRTDTSIASVLGVAANPTRGEHVLCTNPAALGGGAAPLETDLPTTGSFGILGALAGLPTAATPWVSYPGRYTAQCEQRNGSSWLDVTPADDSRPLLQAELGPRWGLHVYDVNIALGDLVRLVSAEAVSYAR